jgi:hypothetical protein
MPVLASHNESNQNKTAGFWLLPGGRAGCWTGFGCVWMRLSGRPAESNVQLAELGLRTTGPVSPNRGAGRAPQRPGKSVRLRSKTETPQRACYLLQGAHQGPRPPAGAFFFYRLVGALCDRRVCLPRDLAPGAGAQWGNLGIAHVGGSRSSKRNPITCSGAPSARVLLVRAHLLVAYCN